MLVVVVARSVPIVLEKSGSLIGQSIPRGVSWLANNFLLTRKNFAELSKNEKWHHSGLLGRLRESSFTPPVWAFIWLPQLICFPINSNTKIVTHLNFYFFSMIPFQREVTVSCPYFVLRGTCMITNWPSPFQNKFSYNWPMVIGLSTKIMRMIFSWIWGTKWIKQSKWKTRQKSTSQFPFTNPSLIGRNKKQNVQNHLIIEITALQIKLKRSMIIKIINGTILSGKTIKFFNKNSA